MRRNCGGVSTAFFLCILFSSASMLMPLFSLEPMSSLRPVPKALPPTRRWSDFYFCDTIGPSAASARPPRLRLHSRCLYVLVHRVTVQCMIHEVVLNCHLPSLCFWLIHGCISFRGSLFEFEVVRETRAHNSLRRSAERWEFLRDWSSVCRVFRGKQALVGLSRNMSGSRRERGRRLSCPRG